MVFQWEMGTFCNFRCAYCYLGWNKDPRGVQYKKVDMKSFSQAMKNFKGSRWSLLGGEPLLHPQFQQLLNIFADNECTIGGNTNLSVEKSIELLLKYPHKQIWVASLHLEELGKRNKIESFVENFEQLSQLNTIDISIRAVEGQPGLFSFKEKYSYLDVCLDKEARQGETVINDEAARKCIAGYKAFFIDTDLNVYPCSTMHRNKSSKLGTFSDFKKFNMPYICTRSMCNCNYSKVFS